jgi:hypothetical protein
MFCGGQVVEVVLLVPMVEKWPKRVEQHGRRSREFWRVKLAKIGIYSLVITHIRKSRDNLLSPN